MHQMNGMRIRYPLSAATRMKQESLQKKLISRWFSLQHGCVKNYNLNEDQVIRHYDVTGKSVRNILWKMKLRGNSFKNNIRKALEE